MDTQLIDLFTSAGSQEPAQVGLGTTRNRRAPGEPKKRAYSATLQRVLPVLGREADPKFAKVATGFTYASQTIFVLFSALIFVELFVSNTTALALVHGARSLSLLTVALMTAFFVAKGHGIPELRVEFNVATLLVLMAVNIAVLTIQSIRVRDERRRAEQQPPKWTLSQVGKIAAPAALILFNMFLLGRQAYRIRWLGKRTTPISLLFTFLSAVLSAGVSANEVRKRVQQIRTTSK